MPNTFLEKILRKENFLIILYLLSVNFFHSINGFYQAYATDKNIEIRERNYIDDSYRLTLRLNNPRKYLTRFDKEKRLLQIRISPARSEEVKDAYLYDNRYIRRVLVEEKNSEVTLSLQLKNFPISWVITTQQDPWRIVVDFWKNEEDKENLKQKWNWQPDIISGKVEDTKIDENLPENNKFNSNVTNINTLNEESFENLFGNENKNNKKYMIPEIFSRLEVIKKMSDFKKLQIKRLLTEKQKNEFTLLSNLAKNLYEYGQEKQASIIFRKILVYYENYFKKNDEILWQAGESAFLTHDYDAASNYLKLLTRIHPGSKYYSYAKLRFIDIDEIVKSNNVQSMSITDTNKHLYSEMALSEKNPDIIKIASSLRVLYGVVDSNPNSVKLYQQNLDRCVTSGRVPFDLLKNCSYYLGRYLVEKDSLINADVAVQRFKKSFPLDHRVAKLEKIVQGRVKKLLTNVAKSHEWTLWTDFEKEVRPENLSFLNDDSDALFTRAQAFQAIDDQQKALQLYINFIKISRDEKKKNEALSISSLLLYNLGDQKRAQVYLNDLQKNNFRISNGLTELSISALKKLSTATNPNITATLILIDEMKAGRYEEKDLATLVSWCADLKGYPQADVIYSKVLAYPAQSTDEVFMVEKTIFKYADDLKTAGQFSKSGDMFFAMASLPRGNRKAEAAYNAGVAFARAGLFEKARSALAMAANDTSDKRYSELARERLDRTKKQ